MDAVLFRPFDDDALLERVLDMAFVVWPVEDKRAGESSLFALADELNAPLACVLGMDCSEVRKRDVDLSD